MAYIESGSVISSCHDGEALVLHGSLPRNTVRTLEIIELASPTKRGGLLDVVVMISSNRGAPLIIGRVHVKDTAKDILRAYKSAGLESVAPAVRKETRREHLIRNFLGVLGF